MAISKIAAANATNDLAQNLQDVASNGEKAKKTTEDLKDDIDKATKAQEKQNQRLKLKNQLLSAGKGSLLAFVQAAGDADKEVTGLVKSLAISKGEAVALKKQFH